MGEPVRFLLDQHIQAAVAKGLKARGIDALTVQEAASGERHAGIAWCPAAKHGIGSLLTSLLLLHAILTPEEMRDHVEYL